MAVFKNIESPEEFKHRLNSLTEKLKKINQNSNARTTEENKRIRFKEA